MRKFYTLMLHFLIPYFLFFISYSPFVAPAQQKHSATSSFTSYKGLVMAGYQGWFNALGDSAGRGWNHYSTHGKFEPGFAKIDLWPEVSEYSKTYQSPFNLPDGSPAYLPSSYDSQTVNLHFKWMKEYGIDGVFIQRFVTNLKSTASLHHNDQVLSNALKASQEFHRAISVMYDFSGMKDEDNDYLVVIKDWKHLVDSLHIADRGTRQTYLYHNGKPLVVIWGVGFPDRKYGLKSTEKVIEFLKNDPLYGGCSIMLGVPTYWRDFGNDTDKDPYLHDVLRKVDIVQPWMVGRFDEAGYPAFKERIKDDIKWCNENKLDYVPVIFPGFSWHNMYPESPMNKIPRNKGHFFWKQITGAIRQGAEMLYIAMFDEIDEGTAIFKISKNPPSGLTNFVSFESDIPPDYYLYLAGFAAKMLRKEIPFQTEIPSPPNKQK